jgi:predicted ATP-grasp superfamily ATP-dependent carboligase
VKIFANKSINWGSILFFSLDKFDQVKDISILIPDGESYIILGVLRCLSLLGGIRLFVMSESANTAIRYSRFITEFIHYPKQDNPKEWIAQINALTTTHDIDIIIPVFEVSSRKLIQYRDLLLKPGSHLLPNLRDFDVAADKRLLSLHLYENNLPCPLTINAARYFEARDPDTLPRFPLLVKPVKSFGGGEGIIRVNERDELLRLFDSHVPDESVILQEYVEGHDLGCNVICRDGEILAFTIQKGTIFSKKPFTPQVGLKMIHEEQVYHTVQKLMKSLNWSGVANVDMRYDPVKRQFLILEINPRFWYTVLASAIAGVNFPKLYCKTVLGENYPVPRYQEISYLNNKGLMISLRRRPWRVLILSRFWKYTPVPFQVRDLKMTVAHLTWSLKNILSGTARR